MLCYNTISWSQWRPSHKSLLVSIFTGVNRLLTELHPLCCLHPGILGYMQNGYRKPACPPVNLFAGVRQEEGVGGQPWDWTHRQTASWVGKTWLQQEARPRPHPLHRHPSSGWRCWSACPGPVEETESREV